MSKLPLKVQVGIREYWDKPDGALQRALKQVKENVGYEVVVQPDWSLLLVELGSFYPDKESLIVVAAAAVEAWCGSLVELTEDEANQEWTDELLERGKAHSQLRLFLDADPSAAKDTKLATTWFEDRAAFVVYLPKKAMIRSSAEAYPIFRSSLLHCFEEPGKKPLSASVASRPAATDDWADVAMDRSTGKPTVIESPAIASSVIGHALPKVETLPSVNMLPRPDDLLARAPYHLVVRDLGSTRLEVQCSHSPSLQLLADYFKRWCRVNHQDTRNPPAVDVLLEQSPWGLGILYDRLVLTTENVSYMKTFPLNPCTVLALVEGVLGYEQVSVDSGYWTYRRDVEYK